MIFFCASVYACLYKPPTDNAPRGLPNFEAKVVSVGWEADCAVLTVENDEFWQDIKAVQLSKKARFATTEVVLNIQIQSVSKMGFYKFFF